MTFWRWSHAAASLCVLSPACHPWGSQRLALPPVWAWWLTVAMTLRQYLCVRICKSVTICACVNPPFTLSLAIFCFCLQTFKSTTLGKIKMNINYLHVHVPEMYNLCKLTAFNSLFHLLSSTCTHCHFKSVTSSNGPPADDIFQAYFQENGCWMPLALFSTDLLHYSKIQHLLDTLL